MLNKCLNFPQTNLFISFYFPEATTAQYSFSNYFLILLLLIVNHPIVILCKDFFYFYRWLSNIFALRYFYRIIYLNVYIFVFTPSTHLAVFLAVPHITPAFTSVCFNHNLTSPPPKYLSQCEYFCHNYLELLKCEIKHILASGNCWREL